MVKPKNTKPNEPIPVLIYYQFMLQDGYTTWGDNDKRIGCINKIRGGLLEDYDHLNHQLQYLMNCFHELVNSGIAIIFTSQYDNDYIFSSECTGLNDPTNTDNIIKNICWNNGDNPDIPYHDTFLKDFKNQTEIFKDLHYDNVGLFGYSGPGHLVSRYINEFPNLTFNNDKDKDGNTINVPYPKINYAIILAAGSYRCFDYGYNTSDIINPYTNNPDPPDWTCTDEDKTLYTENCCTNFKLGCCPVDKYEDNYQNYIKNSKNKNTNLNDKFKNHPPTLLLQVSNDNYSDSNASTKYFNTLSDDGFKQVYKNKFNKDIVCEVNDNKKNRILKIPGTVHGMVAQQQQVFIDFIKYYSNKDNQKVCA